MKKKYLSRDESAYLIEYLESAKDKHSMIIELLLYTGIRQQELWDLKIKDLDFLNEVLILDHGAKGSDGRMLGLPKGYVTRARGLIVKSGLGLDAKLVEGLGYKSEGGTVATMKSTLRRSWGVIKRRVWGVARSPRLGLHGLRHTYCVNYYMRSGSDIHLTQLAMGHLSVVNTMKYLMFVDMPKHLTVSKGLYENL